MNRSMVRRLSAVGVTTVLVLGGGGVAFAYFTSAGSGSGSATIGTVGANDIVITGSGPTGNLYPGSAPIGYTVQAENTGSGNEHVDDVTVSVAADESGDALDTSGNPIVGCLASWFSVDSPVVIDTTLSPGSYSAGVYTSIGLTEADVDQDACQGVSVKLLYDTANPV